MKLQIQKYRVWHYVKLFAACLAGATVGSILATVAIRLIF
jgi:hypothetical protein